MESSIQLPSNIAFVSTISPILSQNASEYDRKGNSYIIKKLSTGQKLGITSQEDQMLMRVFKIMSGFSRRLTQKIPADPRCRIAVENEDQLSDYDSNDRHTASTSLSSRTMNESNQDTFISGKETNEIIANKCVKTIEYNVNESNDFKSLRNITFKDIETIIKKLGANMSKKSIEQMIWEIDEDLDGQISWDEFQLCYYRNAADNSNVEPKRFFRLMEFFIFDELNKGYIVEDDCMEALFARHGSASLESELRAIFGNNLRSQGGTGTLNLQGYINAMEAIDGKTSIIGL